MICSLCHGKGGRVVKQYHRMRPEYHWLDCQLCLGAGIVHCGEPGGSPPGHPREGDRAAPPAPESEIDHDIARWEDEGGQ